MHVYCRQEPLFEQVYSPLAPRSPSSSRTGAAPPAASGPYTVPGPKDTTQLHAQGTLGTPTGVFQVCMTAPPKPTRALVWSSPPLPAVGSVAPDTP